MICLDPGLPNTINKYDDNNKRNKQDQYPSILEDVQRQLSYKRRHIFLFKDNLSSILDVSHLYGSSSGNLVDGLPLALHTKAVSASWENRGRVTIDTLGQQNHMLIYISDIKMFGNFDFLYREYK